MSKMMMMMIIIIIIWEILFAYLGTYNEKCVEFLSLFSWQLGTIRI